MKELFEGGEGGNEDSKDKEPFLSNLAGKKRKESMGLSLHFVSYILSLLKC